MARFASLALAGLLAGVTAAPAAATATATVYSGGDILTMSGPDPVLAEALVERGGRITYVAPLAGALRTADAVAPGASALWASYGQTTAQECGVGLGSDDIALVRNAIDKRLLTLDLYICAKDSHVDAMAAAAAQVLNDYGRLNPSADAGFQRQEGIVSAAAARPGDTTGRLLALRPDLDRRYVNRVRLGGIKFWLDGSLPTAWMSQPYAVPPPGAEPRYRAYQQIPDAVLEATFDKYWTGNVQINMHMNGDAAAEQALRAIEKMVARHGMADHRPVFVHASYVRPDQIRRMRRWGRCPPSSPPASFPAATRW